SSAEKELSRALTNGLDIDEAALALIQSAFRAENYATLTTFTENYPSLNASDARYLKFYQALAALQEGTAQPNLSNFDPLIDAPEADLDLYAKAVLEIKSGNTTKVLEILDATAKDAPIAIEIILFRAQAHAFLGQVPEAITYTLDYLKRVPSDLKTRLSLAQLYLNQQQLDKSAQQIDIILRFAPNHGFTNYLKAIVDYETKDFTKAKEAIDKALMFRFTNTQSRLLAGIINYELGLFSQALDHLTSIQSELINFPQAQKMLAVLQLQAGEYIQAGSTLNASTLTEDDITLAAGTIFQLLRRGESFQANSLISKIEEAGLNNTSEALSALGQLKLSIPGKTDSAIADLEKALLLDPSRHDARATLAASYIRQQQYDKAIALADDWVAQTNTAAAGHNLKALVNILTDDISKANIDIQNALDAEKNNIFAKFLMATLQERNNNLDEALATLKEIISLKADYEPAVVGSYRLSKILEKDVTPIIQTLKNNYTNNPENMSLLSVLVGMLQQEKNASEIINLLDPILKSPQAKPAFVYAGLGNAYLLQQNYAQALVMTEQWFNINPKNPSAALAYANLLTYNNRREQALNVIEQLIKDYPEDENLKLFKFDLLGQLKQFKTALAWYMQLRNDVQNNPRVQAQAGRYYAENGEKSKAEAKLKQSYEQSPVQETLLALAEVMQGVKPTSEIVDLIEKHQISVGKSNDISLYLANLLINSDINRSSQIYREILANQVDNPFVLNNYAWILAEKGDINQALQHIEKAIKLQSDHPDIIDTYGKVLSLHKKYAEAEIQFEKSLTIRPNHPEVILNYAESLIAADKLDKARSLLEGFNPNSPHHKEKLKTLLVKL
ncbi:MAG: PEP-CTERM system TPR-repeat protein PrsT, partial [Paraglaciecola sp.]|nr:PEP-CTERM system TPR-repeat protein PrsT [Paraglaciecola sp.]